MTLDQKVVYLQTHGFYAGPRDPKRNTAFEGAFMVCEIETLDAPESRDAENTGYCVVGDNLAELVQEALAVNDFKDEFDELFDPADNGNQGS